VPIRITDLLRQVEPETERVVTETFEAGVMATNVECLLSLRSYFDALIAGKTLLRLPLKL
jgi:hypothetical protein